MTGLSPPLPSEELATGNPLERGALEQERPVADRPGAVSVAGQFPDNELFDDYGLADSVAAITGRSPESAEELTSYLLLILEALGEGAPETVRRTLGTIGKDSLSIHGDFPSRS
jgi:hypothetical protein